MGKFIAIEGGDGSGKATQSKLLFEYLSSQGKNVRMTSFPRYGEASAYYVERYLNGDYGEAADVPADLAALAYALDRFAAKAELTNFLQEPEAILIADRYMASNLAHQGTKIDDTESRKEFYERTIKTEYDILGIPRPNKNIVLVVPTDIAQTNVDKKETRSYTALKRDIHEKDATHLDKAKMNYEELCSIYPEEFQSITCTDDQGTMRSIDEVQSLIRRQLGYS
jgi:dTMP kinase